MLSATRSSIAAPTRTTLIAVATVVAIILGSLIYLVVQYPGLPGLLPVHFRASGFPDGWQFKSPARVLVPVLVQIALALALGAIGGLLLSRPGADALSDAEPDIQAATVAAETVILITLIWVAFQAYAAWALVQMWTVERAGLGRGYYLLEAIGVAGTIATAVRAHRRLGRPAPRPFVAEHWRLGQLYKNPNDPALFVPTRDGHRWTLNFGRPVAAALLGLILLLGVLGPTVILGLMLRGS